ncbi:hypothetical protein MRB53_039768 [Persea americana]|nr:hypothetical protein MRB53_039768 [Persea americana]
MEEVAASPTLWQRISSWSADNKAVIYTVAGVIVVGTATGIYLYRKPPQAPSSPSSPTSPHLEKNTTPAEKKAHADSLKKIGNEAYSKRDYTVAIEYYSKAIETVPNHVYYSNRAACYASLNDQDKVISDTTESLKLEPTYIKALNRRALAYDTFRQKPTPEITSEDETQGDVHLKRAFEAILAKQYKEAIQHLDQALQRPFSKSDLEALALNASATFKFVKADVPAALSEIDRSIQLSPTMTNSYVKRASMHMESGDRQSTMIDFQKAIDINAEDPDIYYHRAIFSLGVAQYKLGSTSASMSTFRRCLSRFPESAEVYNYYGELLLDQGKFEEAIEKFDTAIHLERSTADGHKNVMPLINKALAVFQWKKDMSQAEELCRRALMLDSESDVALATLSQFLLTQGKAKDALQYFQRSAEVARTEARNRECS